MFILFANSPSIFFAFQKLLFLEPKHLLATPPMKCYFALTGRGITRFYIKSPKIEAGGAGESHEPLARVFTVSVFIVLVLYQHANIYLFMGVLLTP